jgi:DNA-binding NarL/FixJ family response regulator
MPITVSIIEDDAEFLRKFSDSIQSDDGFLLQGVAANGADGLRMVARQRSDVYLVDLGLPDMSGIEVIRSANERWPDCEIMVITVFGDEVHVIESIEAGASGYLLKDSSQRDILDNIRMLNEGGSPVSPVIARKILQKFHLNKSRLPTPQLPGILTEREVQVLQVLSKGLSFKEIGEAHDISAHTVARHVKTIYRKLAVHSRGEAVYEATRMGLIQL